MVETRVFCDRCHERVVERRSSFRASCGPARHTLESIDFCGDCLNAFASWLKTFPHSKPAAGDGKGNGEQRKRTARAAE